MTIDEFFTTSHERERPIFDVVSAHLEGLGSVVVEAVQVGIFFKNGPMFAELRPMKKWMALTFLHPTKLDSTRFSRKVVRAGGNGSRFYHVINVANVEQIDQPVLDWLTEAYLATEQ